jgi:ribosome biogenesis SPOUT family RNA methylase Rps3
MNLKQVVALMRKHFAEVDMNEVPEVTVNRSTEMKVDQIVGLIQRHLLEMIANEPVEENNYFTIQATFDGI